MRYGASCRSCVGVRVVGEGRGGMCDGCTARITGRMIGRPLAATARAEVDAVRVTVAGITERVPQDGYVTDKGALRDVVTRHLDTFGAVVSVEDVPLHWRDGRWQGGTGHYVVTLRVK